jgi:putative oxidoreductase
MRIAMIVVRTLMGLLFIFSAVTFFLNLVPMPQLEGPIKTLFEGLNAAGYFFPILKATELLCGLLFVSGRFVPLATVVIAPIIVNIFCVNIWVNPAMPGPAIATFLVAANIFVAYYYREAYRPLLRSKPA